MPISPESVEFIKRHFHANDPELVLVSYEDHSALFQLQDCDGYRIGRLHFSKISFLCLTTQGESYRYIQIYDEKRIPDDLSWLKDQLPRGHYIVALESAMDDDDSVLPMIEGRRRGFLLCGNLTFETEKNPGRG